MTVQNLLVIFQTQRTVSSIITALIILQNVSCAKSVSNIYLKSLISFFKYISNLKILSENGQQLLYNAELIQCDYPERVNCGERPICDENDENCVEPPEHTTKPPNGCSHFGPCTENGELVAQGDCERCFCECAAGHYEEICCSQELKFNPVELYCDWPYNIATC